jgi:predicted Zn-dependent protease
MTPYSYEHIARYAEGEMTAEEKQSFEQALAADLSLQEQLVLYREVHGSLQQHFYKDEKQEQLENTLRQMRGEYFGKKSKVVSINRYLRYAVAAAAVLLVTLFLWKPWQPLYDQYSDVEMTNPAERGSTPDSLLEKAAVAFNDEDFTNAVIYLEQANKLQPGDSFTQYYYGLALLQKGEPGEARKILEPLHSGESAFKYEATFYIALSYLKEENKAACREWLQKIPADAAKHAKAKELLRKL